MCRVSRWWPNWDIYPPKFSFGLVYGVIYQFLGMEAKNYKFGMFCQQCHPRWCRYLTENCFPDSHLPFVYVVIFSFLSPIWRIWETNLSTITSKILFSIVVPTFRKSCRRPWLHGVKKNKVKLAGGGRTFVQPGCILKQIFRDGGHQTGAGPEAHHKICKVLIAQTCSIFLNQVC